MARNKTWSNPRKNRHRRKVSCNSCHLLLLNSLTCHEFGCPNTPRYCRECKRQIRTDRREFCSDRCYAAFYQL